MFSCPANKWRQHGSFIDSHFKACSSLLGCRLEMVSLKHAKNVLWSQVSKHGRLHVVFYRQRHLKYEQLKHCVGKTKTNHVVLQTLSTTFQFLRAFWILVYKHIFLNTYLFWKGMAGSEFFRALFPCQKTTFCFNTLYRP